MSHFQPDKNLNWIRLTSNE